MSQLSTRFAFSICLCLIASANAAAQSRWIHTGFTSDSAIWFLDKAFTKTKSGTVTAWEKVIYPDGAYSLGLNEWNCSAKKKRLLQSHSYDTEDEVIGVQTTPLPWRFVTPDSIEEKTFKIICADSISKRKIVEDDNGESASAASLARIIKKSALLSAAAPGSRVIRRVAVGEKLFLVSKKSNGVWYQVFDPRTGSSGWLNGNHFKIVEAVAADAGKRKLTRSRRGK